MLLVGYEIVVVSLKLDKLSSVDVSVDDSVDKIASSVSLVLCVTGHIVVSSGFTAGNDSSGESSVDDEIFTVGNVEVDVVAVDSERL